MVALFWANVQTLCVNYNANPSKLLDLVMKLVDYFWFMLQKELISYQREY
jgi:hypothetical protein